MTPDSDDQAADLAHQFADMVSVASDFGAAWVLVCALQVVRGQRSAASSLVRLASAGLVSLTLTRSLKRLFAVPRRPSSGEATLARTPSSPGFPSGHTLAAFTSALTIPVRSRGTGIALGFATLVAWARVRVGHHQAADVVAGAAAGTVAGLLLRLALPSARGRR